MEKEYQINTEDDYKIFWKLNSKIKSDKLIIFVHWLGGDMNEHIFYNGSKYFNNKWLDTFRFDLYSWKEKARKLKNCTIKLHSLDLDTVLNYFKDDYKYICLVWHSMWGPTILWSKQYYVKSIVLWDPMFNVVNEMLEEVSFNKVLWTYVIDRGIEFFVSKQMIDEWKDLDDRLLKYIIKPTKIICAWKWILNSKWKGKINTWDKQNNFITIKNASHCFDEEWIEEKLFEETLQWIKK